MCLYHVLLAGQPLPEVRDDPAFPGLRVEPIPPEYGLADALRPLHPAPYLYSVGPGQHCGCYFTYDSREEFEAHLAGLAWPQVLSPEERRTADETWQQGYDAIHSFASYLGQHVSDTDLAVYVYWEGCAGTPLRERFEVRPSFFGGPSFPSLPDNSLLVIRGPGPTSPAGASAGTSAAALERRAVLPGADDAENARKRLDLEDQGWEYVGPQCDGWVGFQRLERTAREVAARDELARWQGEWRCCDQSLIIQGDRWRWCQTGQVTPEDCPQNRIRIVRVGDTMTVADLLVEEEPLKGDVCKAIFRLDGDTLWYSGSYEARPTGFTDGSGYAVEWKRATKLPAEPADTAPPAPG